MARDIHIAVMLAVLVSLGGCSGIIPGDGSPEGQPTPSAPRSYEKAVENHSPSLRNAGQFKLRWVRSVEYPERVVNSSPHSSEMVADFESDEYLRGEELEGHNGIYQSGAGYQAGSTVWRRTELDNGSTVYRRVPSDNPFSVRNNTLYQIWLMENFSTKFPLERNGTAIFQGQPVTRYTADELGQAEQCLLQSRPPVVGNVTSVEVVALVDNRGIIRKFECTLSGETVTGEPFEERQLWTITGIGTVEVREPRPLVNETRGG